MIPDLIRRILDWLGRPSGADELKRVPEDKKDDLVDNDLYDIGDVMCRWYDDGIGSYTRAKHLGRRSMEAILRDWCEGRQLDQDMVADLDRLLRESKRDHSLYEEKVEQFRDIFYQQFSDEEIRSVFKEIYENEKSRIALDELFEEKETESTVFEYHRYPESEPDPQMVSEEAELAPEPMEFETETKELKKVGTILDLQETHITESIQSFAEEEAKLAWDALDVTGPRRIDWNDPTEEVFDAMYEVESTGYRPDTMVVRLPGSASTSDFRFDVYEDGSGVMDAPFVLADSERVGYRVTGVPVEMKRTLWEGSYRYTMKWTGNYVVTNEDAYAGLSRND